MRTLAAYIYDAETADYWPLYEEDGRLYGFPNSSCDGTPVGGVVFTRWCWVLEAPQTPESGIENTVNLAHPEEPGPF